jgi:hypothetical protein
VATHCSRALGKARSVSVNDHNLHLFMSWSRI